MQIGKLNKRIELQRITETADSYGEPVQTWTTYATRWANVSPLKAQEMLVSSQNKATTTHIVTIRYLDGITIEDRIKLGSRYLNIDSIVNQDERGEQLILSCTEVL